MVDAWGFLIRGGFGKFGIVVFIFLGIEVGRLKLGRFGMLFIVFKVK